jgi:methionyl-tRNA formyltransferase
MLVFASSKPWSRQIVEDHIGDFADDTIFISTKPELLSAFNHAEVRMIFFLHWNWIVPKAVTDKIECVCFHMTDLPFGRGGSPLQNLIVRGFKQTKLSAIRMTDGLDAGPIYCKSDLSLDGTALDVYMRATHQSMLMAKEILVDKLIPCEQQGEVVTFERRKPSQSILPSAASLREIYDHIRMLDAPSYPPAFVEVGDMRLEFYKAEFEDGILSAEVKFKEIGNGAK